MACNCKKGASDTHGLLYHESRHVISASGVFEQLAGDGVEAYHGLYLSADVWVVAMATEQQRVFLRAQATDAKAYYKQLMAEGRSTIDHVLARNMPHDLMLNLLGA